MDHRVCYADVQKVPLHNTGLTQRALFLKQVASVGALAWLDTAADLSQSQLGSHVHIKVWCFGTDAGGDQVGADKLLDRDFQLHQRFWKVVRTSPAALGVRKAGLAETNIRHVIGDDPCRGGSVRLGPEAGSLSCRIVLCQQLFRVMRVRVRSPSLSCHLRRGPDNMYNKENSNTHQHTNTNERT